jgi:formylglycine-generating enzyme required for sulfatase activity
MRFLKVGGVILGALLITTLGINAADVFSGNSGSLLGQLIATEQGMCPGGMVEVPVGKTFSCIDVFESSAGPKCPTQNPGNNGETQGNINALECAPSSIQGKGPWTHVSREQAQVLCMRAGKRLPTAAEWYTIALGTPNTDTSCNTHAGGAVESGSFDGCRSAAGVHDAIGNVWEWTDDDVIEGQYNGRTLPSEGYVMQVASDGIATVTEVSPSEQFASGYIWTQQTGAYGLLRGGYYASGDDAGVYAVQAKTIPTAATVAIGFRCIK